ncbi:MAG: PilZ domain-containing protein [Candidatus Acidiferrum sp.]
MNPDRRGFRFSVNASAEIAPEGSPSATVPVRATEISLHGCHLESLAPFAEGTAVFVKIFYENDYFEAKGTVIYVKPAEGMGVEFRDLKPHCKVVLQRWILAALRKKAKPE